MAFFPQATAQHFAALDKAMGDFAVPATRVLFAAGPRDGGWQVVQVWAAKSHLDAFNQAVLFPAMAKLGDAAFPASPQVIDFESAFLSERITDPTAEPGSLLDDRRD